MIQQSRNIWRILCQIIFAQNVYGCTITYDVVQNTGFLNFTKKLVNTDIKLIQNRTWRLNSQVKNNLARQ